MSLEYKLLDAGESDLLCQGIERVYGTTYPSPEFYDPAFVENAVNSGVLHCVVAMNNKHEVVGCMSTVLEESGDLTADGSALMVAPEYRGQGIVANLGQEMLETYQRLSLGGLHLYALALHDRVQKQSQNAGAVVTGVLPAWFSRAAKVSGYAYPDARIGAVTLFMPLASLPSRTCYLPQRYEPLLTGIYQKLKLERNLIPSTEAPHLANTSLLTVEKKPANRQHRVVLKTIGSDFSILLNRLVEECEAENAEVIYLDTPLDDPASNEATELAKESGFIFGALMVDRRGSDRLRLQRYRSTISAPEHMVIASAEAAEILEFVLSESRALQGH